MTTRPDLIVRDIGPNILLNHKNNLKLGNKSMLFDMAFVTK